MTLREKQRLQRIIRSNASAYRQARRSITLDVMRGSAGEMTLAAARSSLTATALAIAEAVATLEEHGDEHE